MKRGSENEEMRKIVHDGLRQATFSASEQARVLRAVENLERKKGKIMKKKLTITLAAALLALLALLLTCGGALALMVSHGYFERVGEMQRVNGLSYLGAGG